MFRVMLAGVVFFQLSSLPDTPVRVSNGIMTGEQFLRSYNAAEQAAYAAGFTNGLLATPFVSTDRGAVDELQQCIIGRTNTQMAEVIRRYINDRPERWNEPLLALGWGAIVASCSKK